jgi:hypothetical protein
MCRKIQHVESVWDQLEVEVEIDLQQMGEEVVVEVIMAIPPVATA